MASVVPRSFHPIKPAAAPSTDQLSPWRLPERRRLQSAEREGAGGALLLHRPHLPPGYFRDTRHVQKHPFFVDEIISLAKAGVHPRTLITSESPQGGGRMNSCLSSFMTRHSPPAGSLGVRPEPYWHSTESSGATTAGAGWGSRCVVPCSPYWGDWSALRRLFEEDASSARRRVPTHAVHPRSAYRGTAPRQANQAQSNSSSSSK